MDHNADRAALAHAHAPPEQPLARRCGRASTCDEERVSEDDLVLVLVPRQRRDGQQTGRQRATRRRIERMISIVLAVGSVALGAQAFVAALGSVQEPEAWHVAFMVANFGSLAALLVTYVVGRSIAPAAITFCAVFVATLVAWPFVVAGQDIPPSDPPWTWFLVSVVTASSIMFLPLVWQMAWTIFVPVLFGITRLAQAGFAVDFWWPTLLDVSFAIILGSYPSLIRKS